MFSDDKFDGPSYAGNIRGSIKTTDNDQKRKKKSIPETLGNRIVMLEQDIFFFKDPRNSFDSVYNLVQALLTWWDNAWNLRYLEYLDESIITTTKYCHIKSCNWALKFCSEST